YGRGWLELDAFREHALGPVTTRQQFLDAVRQARVLVHASTVAFAHPIDALSRPVPRPAGLSEAALLAAAQALLAPSATVSLLSLTPLTPDLVLETTRPPLNRCRRSRAAPDHLRSAGVIWLSQFHPPPTSELQDRRPEVLLHHPAIATVIALVLCPALAAQD